MFLVLHVLLNSNISPYNNSQSFHTPEVSQLLDDSIRMVELFYAEVDFINAGEEEIKFYYAIALCKNYFGG